jgi:hypothetical protein
MTNFQTEAYYNTKIPIARLGIPNFRSPPFGIPQLQKKLHWLPLHAAEDPDSPFGFAFSIDPEAVAF